MQKVGSLIAVAVGGGLGAVTRHLVALSALSKLSQSGFPYPTLVVNIVGCFLLGVFLESEQSSPWLQTHMRHFWAIGFLGGLTTFSTFSAEIYQLFVLERWVLLSLYISASGVGGVLSVAGGVKVVRFIQALS